MSLIFSDQTLYAGMCAESMNWRLVVVMLCDVKGATLDYCCIPIMWILGRQNDCLLMEMSGNWCYIILL